MPQTPTGAPDGCAIARASSPKPPASSTTRSASIPATRTPRPPSTGAAVSTKPWTTSRPTPSPTTAHLPASTSTSSTPRWPASASPLWVNSAGFHAGARSHAARAVRVLQESFPADSPHLAKARLLANAGLNDYIPQEIAADPDSSSWSALAEAQIYASYGESYRAMRALKRALPSAASASIKSIPLAYWRILFPEAWWDTVKAESAKNNLDPYLVASLIRQECEFNPS